MGNVPVITIDGPSGVGKSTLCKLLAKILKWHILDSGVFYRIIALLAVRNKLILDLNDEDDLVLLLDKFRTTVLNKGFKFNSFLMNMYCMKMIRNEIIGNFASMIACLPIVREKLLYYQRSFCVYPGLIADGRDMGTVVFPNAMVKIFLYASNDVRNERRVLDLRSKGLTVDFEQVELKIKERDDRDYNRKIAPLVPAIGAYILDTTNMSMDEVVFKVLLYVRQVLHSYKKNIEFG